MSLVSKFLKICPCRLRARIVRNKISIDYNIENDFIVKIAETKEDLEGAFKVLHDCYVEKDYMQVHTSGFRLTPYHILPTTTTFIVKENSKVISTMSMIKDGALGVPSESLFDLSFLRDQGLRLAEISSLGILP